MPDKEGGQTLGAFQSEPESQKHTRGEKRRESRPGSGNSGRGDNPLPGRRQHLGNQPICLRTDIRGAECTLTGSQKRYGQSPIAISITHAKKAASAMYAAYPSALNSRWLSVVNSIESDRRRGQWPCYLHFLAWRRSGISCRIGDACCAGSSHAEFACPKAAARHWLLWVNMRPLPTPLGFSSSNSVSAVWRPPVLHLRRQRT
jgi:hypothetical protein